MNFPARLLNWYSQNQRMLPWRSDNSPYNIWVSEIILQQTRMEQGVAFYTRFLEAFPDIYALAAASENDVMRIWQGFGYYSRARNLHASAKEIVENRHGRFPNTKREWEKLKGVGPYTAAAIASMAYGETVPALDGNVFRILSRLFAIEYSIDTGRGKKAFMEVAESLIDKNHPGEFNQAMMDFGAMICKPANPECKMCIFNRECIAFKRNAVAKYPVKKARRSVSFRHFNYFFFYPDNRNAGWKFFVKQRTEDDIWKHLYELPLLETSSEAEVPDILQNHWWKELFGENTDYTFSHAPKVIRHKLTHQTIIASFFNVMVGPGILPLLSGRFTPVSPGEFEQYAKPMLILRFLQQTLPELNRTMIN